MILAIYTKTPCWGCCHISHFRLHSVTKQATLYRVKPVKPVLQRCCPSRPAVPLSCWGLENPWKISDYFGDFMGKLFTEEYLRNIPGVFPNGTNTQKYPLDTPSWSINEKSLFSPRESLLFLCKYRQIVKLIVVTYLPDAQT